MINKLSPVSRGYILCMSCEATLYWLNENNCLCALCRDYVQYWAHRGVEVVAWTVNTKVEKDYYQELLQVNYITDSLVEDCEPHY